MCVQHVRTYPAPALTEDNGFKSHLTHTFAGFLCVSVICSRVPSVFISPPAMSLRIVLIENAPLPQGPLHRAVQPTHQCKDRPMAKLSHLCRAPKGMAGIHLNSIPACFSFCPVYPCPSSFPSIVPRTPQPTPSEFAPQESCLEIEVVSGVPLLWDQPSHPPKLGTSFAQKAEQQLAL